VTKRITTSLAFLTVVFVLSTNVRATPISWTDWTAFTAGNLTGTASGAINTGSNTVNVSYAGQVGNNSVVNGVGGNTSWLPASTFSGGNVSNGPAPNRDNITLTGGTGTGVNTITFDSAVVDPVMAIWSLGAGGAPASFVFLASEPFTIQSGGPSVEFGGSSITAAGNVVNGVEGNGTIQFHGTFTQLSWTNPQFEFYYAFTVGAAGTTAAPVPEPRTYIMLGTGLLGISVLMRRKAYR
jgi:PEP-CTERM motif-containing protein